MVMVMVMVRGRVRARDRARHRGSYVRCAACRPPLSMVHCSGTMTRA
jgi:hypothetical protein